MSISAHLLAFPQWLAILLVVALAVLYSVVGFLVVYRYFPFKIRQIHNDVAGFVFATLGVIYGVLLASVVVFVWEQLYDAKVNAEKESSTALILYHNIVAFPDKPSSDAMLAGLTRYALSSGDDEGAMDKLLALIGGINPDSEHEQILYTQILQNLNDLAEYRNLRWFSARDELPGIILTVLVIGAMVTIGFTFLFGTENVRAHVTMTSLLASLIAIVIFVVIELDHPSMGTISIGTPEGYSRILEIMRARP